jgi:hypothetical protein
MESFIITKITALRAKGQGKKAHLCKTLPAVGKSNMHLIIK